MTLEEPHHKVGMDLKPEPLESPELNTVHGWKLQQRRRGNIAAYSLGLPGCTRAAPSGPTGVRTQSLPAGPRRDTDTDDAHEQPGRGLRQRQLESVGSKLSGGRRHTESTPGVLSGSFTRLRGRQPAQRSFLDWAGSLEEEEEEEEEEVLVSAARRVRMSWRALPI
ncbi:hypothetical protein EYF80_037612 [Liparis tanakae]|uniref:Uncharacterized protein n=1 Tax=Liparis tanakae TaxID=230148 RepID=A0A4Z2GHN8_9TELE|nr:hypothetical protein EYF80_037612 [Liparis tanakae]